MDGESTPRVPDWLDPEKLFQFIRELQAAKYNIGVGEYIAAQDLVLALIGRGEDLSHPQRLKTLLGPLLVSTPFEQEDFARRYDLWIQRLGYAAAQEAAPAMPPVVEEKSFLSLRRRWLVILGILFLLLVGSGLIYLFSNGTFNLPAGTVKVPATTTGQAIPTGAVQIPWLWIGGVLVFGALVWLVLRWLNERQAQMFLERHTSRETPQILPLVVQTSPQALEPVYPGLTFLRLAQGLRQRVEMPSTELDVGKTVLQTVKKGGWFTPVYASRPVMPEYLVLVDRSRPGDHQAEFAFEMIRRLRELHVYISGYYFKGDPRLCYPMEGGAPQSLWEITTLRSHHRLILISDAANLINPFSGEPESWIERFAEMPERALLTPEPVERWGYREYQLSEFFTVLPATPEGLELFVQTLRSGEGVLQVEASPGEPLPEALLQDPQRWLSTTPPEPAQVKALLAGLRKHLRADGYTWLCACAIYPELHWELTVFFGEWLQGQPNRGAIEPEALGRLRVLSPRRLMDLARLPWMRHNYIPDWLRLELIGSLSKEQEQELRQALYRLLGSAVVKPEGGMLLEISRSVRRLMPQVARQLSRQEGEDNPYQDRVFLTFLSGRNPNSLAVRLPEALRRALAARPSLRGLVEGMLENLTARREEPVRLEKEARPQPAPLANIRVGQRVLPWWVAYLAWVVLSGLGGLVGGFLGDSIAPDTLTLSWVAANFLAAVGQWLLLRRVLKGFWVWIPANVAVNIFLGVILKTSLSGILIFVTILLSSTGQLVVLERYTRRAWTWPLGSLASFGLLTLIDGISSSFAWSINLALALLIVCLAVIHFLLLTWMLQPAALKPEPKWGQPSERPFAPEAQWPRDRWVILAGWVAAWGLTFLLDLLASSTVWPLITDSATKIMLQNLTFGLLLFAIQWWLLRRYTPIGVDWLWFSLGAGFLATAAIYGAGAVSFPFTFLPGLAVLGVQILLLRPLTRRYLAWVSILIPQIVFGYFLNDYLQGLFTSSIVLQSGGISTQGLAFLAYGLAHASEGAILIWLLAPSARRGEYTEKEPASKAARRKQVVPRWLRQVGSGLGTTGAVILGLMVLALSSRITWGLGIMLVSLFLSRAFIPGLLINYLNVAFASGFGLFGYGLYRTKRAAFIFQLVMAGATFIFIGNSYTLSTPGSTITFTGIAYSLLFTLATSLGLVLWLAVAERLAEKREGMILLLAEAAGVVSNLIFHGLVFGSLTLTFSSLTSVIQWGIGPFLLGYLPRYLWDVNRKREARAAYLKKHPPKTNKMEAVQSMETESSTTAETPETLTESPQPSEDSQTPADKAQPTTRTLYEWEIREFYPLFGDTLDYSRVRIHENATFTDLIDRIGRRLKGMPPSSEGSHNAITLGNHCYFPVSLPTELLPLDHRENYKLPWLAHEVTHAWQFQQQGWMYLVRAILAQLRERERAYDYGGEDGLAKARKLGRRFADFNPEQQGNIVQTYYARQRAGRESSAFEPFIADLQGRDDTLKVA
jgi:hypothetical protein